MYGTSVFQIAHDGYCEVFQGALCLVNCEQVEHCLRGVLIGSVAGVDYRYGGNLGSIACRSFEVVAHDDEIGIIAEHHDGIFQRLPLGGAAGSCI